VLVKLRNLNNKWFLLGQINQIVSTLRAGATFKPHDKID